MSRKSKVSSPIRWFGAKGALLPKLLPLIPPHLAYVEVFGGGGAMLFTKERSPVEVYNDLDSDLVNFFKILRDKEKFEQFKFHIDLSPYSREQFYEARETYKTEDDPILRAVKWYIIARQSFGGLFGSGWSYSINVSTRGAADVSSSWLRVVDMLPEFHQRLQGVQIENDDFRKIFSRYDDVDSFFYVDPPYVHSTRKGGKYNCEMTDEDHNDLVDILLSLKGKALLSGYDNDLYKKLEDRGWKKEEYSMYTNILSKSAKVKRDGNNRKEVIWYNG